MIQHFVPFSTYESPSRTARVFMAAASLPASRSDSAYENVDSPAATAGRNSCLSSSLPDRIRPIVPSLLTPGISELDAQTRAISSTTIEWAIRSAPGPPYASGTWMPSRSARLSSSWTSHGYSAVSSISAARGAILSSASSRTDLRRSWCSSVSP